MDYRLLCEDNDIKIEYGPTESPFYMGVNILDNERNIITTRLHTTYTKFSGWLSLTYSWFSNRDIIIQIISNENNPDKMNFEVVAEEIIDFKNNPIIVKINSLKISNILSSLSVIKGFKEETSADVYIDTISRLGYNELEEINEFISKCTDLKVFEDYGGLEHEIKYKINLNINDDEDYRRIRSLSLIDQYKKILNVNQELSLVTNIKGNSNLVLDKPYVCISEYSFSNAKLWKYTNGWQELVDYLKDKYNVVVISKEATFLTDIIDNTGDISIQERAYILRDAEFFIGLSSGLSWLANLVKTHVFLINTATLSMYEFQDNVTHISLDGNDYCIGCINKPYFVMDQNICPTDFNFECSRLLSTDMIIREIESYVG